jgi:heat shock protein HslJ
MNTKNKLLLSMILVGLLVASCSVLRPSGANELDGKQWELLYIRKSTPLEGSTITIEFENGEVHGRSGCNSYFGEYTVKGNEISFGMLAATEMACMDPEGIMQQEQEYLTFLSEVVAWSVEGEQLILKKEGQDQLTFQKALDE